MKSIFLISLIAALIGMALADDMDSASHLCMAEAKVTEKEVNEFYTAFPGKLDSAPMNLKCHLKCVMEKLGELKNGILDVEKIMKNWNDKPEIAGGKVPDAKAFENCKNEKGPNDCETAVKIQQCLRK